MTDNSASRRLFLSYKVLPDADVVFGALTPEMLPRAKSLRWLQAIEAGMEHILFPELVESNVVPTNMARMFAPRPRRYLHFDAPGPQVPRAISADWCVLVLPQPADDAAHRRVLARTSDPPHGAAGRERPALHQRVASDERGGQTARLLIREEIRFQ